ncbi:MAG: hypothetical protein CVV05_13910 [Gammaproteobacteria bacterium HGW-Gammaproteobacteria-1]|nr:MAG: hypothetical protein CVV05_13910 [Gammaproteobacteria bacterium HGW-Gammaproteobacteria-1]
MNINKPLSIEAIADKVFYLFSCDAVDVCSAEIDVPNCDGNSNLIRYFLGKVMGCRVTAMGNFVFPFGAIEKVLSECLYSIPHKRASASRFTCAIGNYLRKFVSATRHPIPFVAVMRGVDELRQIGRSEQHVEVA